VLRLGNKDVGEDSSFKMWALTNAVFGLNVKYSPDTDHPDASRAWSLLGRRTASNSDAEHIRFACC
jgi:hypothetical protein